MQAIILAAGMGKRLKELTQNNTKCMIRVNGVTLIDRMLHQLEKLCLSRIVIVVGYEGKKLIDYINSLNICTPITYVNNPIYDKTNNIYSLSLAKDYLCQEDSLLFESDLIFEDAVIKTLIEDPRDTLALVDKYESWMDGTCVKLGEDDSIDEFVPGSKFKYEDIKSYYKTVNIYKFGQEFSKTLYVPFLNAYEEALGLNEYYEQVLRVITILDNPGIKAKQLNGEKWYEIDDIQDLNIAESMFAKEDGKRANLLQERYGGYWRYPQLMDFSYLVTPYFPPKKMRDEMKASFETLLTQYPSGMKINALLAAKNFNVHQENIIVGNGAAELIKALLERFTGKIGIIRPTFEEYPHRYRETDIVCYWPDNEEFRYGTEDIIQFFEKNPVENLILINPDNPSGNYIEKKELLRLISWSKMQNIKLVIDESFTDFAEEENNTLFESGLLNENPHLYVMKSISKSYGVPGLRIGIMASGDVDTVDRMKKDVSIWNINSFAEFYMQIAEKYNKDYKISLEKFRKERDYYYSELKKIGGIKSFPSQANYIMAEITNGMTSSELTKILVVEHNILIKDLSEKIEGTDRQYVRIAIKNREENDKLMKALKEVLENGSR
ncbi:aminotransferase class I/II-fold pyridoxal phosphate-dependent enzyme [Mediterraneibacter sp. NSJ-55]|uniref:Aminotransferase n=1 Tax=Mediterraneibacter hominis TaxID=2763054 RepID=A0A923RQQ0_9FIRM|nr:aminotransferase class I/II-fold pyridoxal phosphate-dependent enzyme [Mediterraneibacter hominis]MBC5689819.1 aminotransferase class I/II-fold pyridoxal phosphate-dependent enzyme [Mediterraneibacter hominis]